MFKLICTNEQGNFIDFTDESKYVITSVDGLNPPESEIIIDSMPNFDGGLYRGSKMTTRNIVITFRIKNPAERNRLDAYRVFKSKRYIKVNVTTNALDVYIEGYVESISCNNFELGQKMQVSIVCPDPYFKNVTEKITNFNVDVPTLEFPFYTIDGEPVAFNTTIGDTTDGRVIIYNNGDSETGMTITAKIKQDAPNNKMIKNLMIKNVETGEFIFIARRATKKLDEYLLIKTEKGEKGIYAISKDPNTQETVTINVVQDSIIDSWLTLVPGENIFEITLDILPEGWTTYNAGGDASTKIIPSGHDTIDDDIYYNSDYYRNQANIELSQLEVVIEANEKWQGV